MILVECVPAMPAAGFKGKKKEVWAWMKQHVGTVGVDWYWTQYTEWTAPMQIAFFDEDADAATVFKLKFGV